MTFVLESFLLIFWCLMPHWRLHWSSISHVVLFCGRIPNDQPQKRRTFMSSFCFDHFSPFCCCLVSFSSPLLPFQNAKFRRQSLGRNSSEFDWNSVRIEFCRRGFFPQEKRRVRMASSGGFSSFLSIRSCVTSITSFFQFSSLFFSWILMWWSLVNKKHSWSSSFFFSLLWLFISSFSSFFFHSFISVQKRTRRKRKGRIMGAENRESDGGEEETF